MIEIFILRHAIAEERSPKVPESERALTPDGKKKMRRVAAGMKRLELEFDLILCSPYKRALQTAILADRALGNIRMQTSRNLLPDCDPGKIRAELEALPEKIRSVALVGHEPHLSRLIAQWVGGGKTVAVTLKKGGLCKLSAASFDSRLRANLEFLVTPRQLILVGGAPKN